LAALGFGGAAIITLTTTISAFVYEGAQGQRYSLLNHWISELGEVAHSELAWLFNAGLIVGGPMLALFMAGLGRIIGGGWGGAIAVSGVVAGIGATAVGLVPMDDLQRHGLAALTFFFAAPVAVGLFTAWLLRERPSDVPRSLVWPGVLTVVAFVTFLALLFTTGDGSMAAPLERPTVWPIAVFEWLTLIGILSWFMAVSAVLWQGHRTDGP
jgi:hypothetical membrane protein